MRAELLLALIWAYGVNVPIAKEVLDRGLSVEKAAKAGLGGGALLNHQKVLERTFPQYLPPKPMVLPHSERYHLMDENTLRTDLNSR
jgi:hypothetical protein